MKKLSYILFSFTLIILLLCAHFSSVEKNLSDNLLRMHIIANSNSKDDQEIKLKVRDSILKEMSEELSSFNSAREAKTTIKEKLAKIETIATNTLKENGHNDVVTVSLENTLFPKKTYKDITLPKGKYDAVKIEIGKSQGENWWCVMFPPLCFVDCANGELKEEDINKLEDSLKEEQAELVTSKKDTVKIKFKLYELWQEGKEIVYSLIK